MNKISKKGVKVEKSQQPKFSKEDQKLLALWTADRVERVLPFFEKDNGCKKYIIRQMPICFS